MKSDEVVYTNADALRFARNLLDISQRELSEELDWSIRQVSNLETGSRPMSRQTMLAVEALLRRKKMWNTFCKECGWKYE